ncbi:MAG: hypothetical protein V7641_3970 [Blastocatellia bacterium]
MKLFAHVLLLIFAGALLSQPSLAQSQTRARTDAGREVTLFPDGTWKYADEAKPRPTSTLNYEKSATAKAMFQTKKGSFRFWYDETKWRLSRPDTTDEGKAQFRLIGEDGYAMIIAEGLAMPVDSLKELAIENAKNAASDVKVVKEEKRIVNGKELLFMQLEGTLKGVPFTYYGYYYGGKEGAIQVIAYTGQNLRDKYKDEFTRFLNGLEIY